MESAIIGLTTFILGVGMGLWCKVSINDSEAECRGYDKGFSDASLALEYLEKRMEGKR